MALGSPSAAVRRRDILASWRATVTRIATERAILDAPADSSGGVVPVPLRWLARCAADLAFAGCCSRGRIADAGVSALVGAVTAALFSV